MNYYIQGDPANADKIKAAFEAKGLITSGHDYHNDNILFFTYDLEGGCKVISSTNANLIMSELIKTHPDYKELELPVEPLFKVGDSLQSGSYWAKIRRIDAENRRYICDFDNVIPFEEQELWSLVPNSKPHYDISNFYAGMPVLVRDYDNSQWSYVQFSHLIAERNVGEGGFKFNACGIPYIQCIPFNEETKHLLGTTDMCPEEYINW